MCAAAARAVGADDFIEALPEGYETSVAERGAALSIGQRQLIAFARALLADPRLLILDEATSSVDIASEAVIEEALARLLAGRTAFVVAHRLSTIRRADLIVVLEYGRVIEQGTHDELMALRRALLRALRRLGRARRLSLADVRRKGRPLYSGASVRDRLKVGRRVLAPLI